MSELAKEIRTRLSDYLAGDLKPNEFHDWFAVMLRDVHQSNAPDAERLAHVVEWQFFDLEHGRTSLDVLRTNLAYLSQEHQEQNPVQFLDVQLCKSNIAHFVNYIIALDKEQKPQAGG